MRRLRFIAMGTAAVLCLNVAVAVQGQEGTGERVGKKADQAFEQLREDAKDVAGQIKKGFEKARAMVDRLGVEGRVYARLHWDKALNNASISVDVGKDGTTTLRGTVADLTAKAKAEQLTGDTVGVQRVVDELAVQLPAAK